MTDAELEQCICSIIVKGMTGPVLPFTSAQAVLAAIRATGRLAPETPKDLLRGAAEIIGRALLAPAKSRDGKIDPLGALVPAAEAGAAYLVPLIAAAAEAKAREECAKMIEPKGPRPCDCESCDCMNVGDAEAVAAWDERKANAAAIRTGSAS